MVGTSLQAAFLIITAVLYAAAAVLIVIVVWMTMADAIRRTRYVVTQRQNPPVNEPRKRRGRLFLIVAAALTVASYLLSIIARHL